jgi:hypothetical protein
MCQRMLRGGVNLMLLSRAAAVGCYAGENIIRNDSEAGDQLLLESQR